LLALFTLLILLEPMFMKLERVTLSSLIDRQDSDSGRRNSAFVPGNSGSVEHLRLLFFTDVHARWLRVPRRAIRRAFAQAVADNVSAVIFGGDLINDRFDVKRGLKVLARLAALSQSYGLPFYGVSGNHDYKLTAEQFSVAGMTLLDGTTTFIKDNKDREWALIGLEDLRTAFCRKENIAYQSNLRRGIPRNYEYIDTLLKIEQQLELCREQNIPPERRIVLQHNPDLILSLPQGEVGYFLSGHFHGGQVWLPFGLEYTFLRQERLCKMGITRGVFRWGKIRGYISRGLGCVSLPIRLGSRPEIAVLELTSVDT